MYQSDFYEDKSRFADVFNSEVIGYDKQRKEMICQNQQAGIKLVGDEYLSRMKKGQKFVPIITLVLYLGKRNCGTEPEVCMRCWR